MTSPNVRQKTVIAVWGAAGNMGTRAVRRLREVKDYHILCVEPVAAREQILKDRGDMPTAPQDALREADVILLAVADKYIQTVAQSLVPAMRSGSVLMMLDPAAAYAGVLPHRSDIAIFVTHPTHPPVFNDEIGEARYDYFGSGLAKQSIVSALVQGDESAYTLGEQISRSYFSPILRSHRVTLEQLAILEPAMSETCGATFIVALKKAMDEAVRRGVPFDAARDFMLGHINVQLAIVFEQIDWKMSEGAYRVIEKAMTRIFQPDWLNVFDPKEVMDSVRDICQAKSG